MGEAAPGAVNAEASPEAARAVQAARARCSDFILVFPCGGTVLCNNTNINNSNIYVDS